MTETSVAQQVYESGVTTSDASARVQRVPVPVASPGSCLLCGKHSHPQGFVFFSNVDFEFYGTLYFCADCVGDIANCFGWMEPDRVNAILAEHAVVLQENEILGRQITELEQAVDALTRYRSSSNDLINVITAAPVEQGVVTSDAEPEQRSDGSSEPEPSEQPGNESDVSEPVNEQGTDDVSSTTGGESGSVSTGGSYLDVISELGLEQ